MDAEKLKRQRQRLAGVSKRDWLDAIDKLTEEMADPKLLGGYTANNEYGRKIIKGGKTRYGAHSEATLKGDPLSHYQGDFVKALYEGEWEWQENKSLYDQLKEIAYSRIPKSADKYTRKKEKEERTGKRTEPVSLDVELIGKPDDYTGEETEVLVPSEGPSTSYGTDEDDHSTGLGVDSDADGDMPDETDIVTDADTAQIYNMADDAEGADDWRWERINEAASGDEKLEAMVKAYRQGLKPKEIRAALDVDSDKMSDLRRKLKRRVTKQK